MFGCTKKIDTKFHRDQRVNYDGMDCRVNGLPTGDGFFNNREYNLSCKGWRFNFHVAESEIKEGWIE